MNNSKCSAISQILAVQRKGGLMDTQFDESDLDCMFYTCTTFFAHRWQLSILMYLFTGPKHFGEILRYHKGLSKKVLASILKKMEQKEIVSKTTYYEGAIQRSRYELTERGLELEPILNEICQWGRKYSPSELKPHKPQTK